MSKIWRYPTEQAIANERRTARYELFQLLLTAWGPFGAHSHAVRAPSRALMPLIALMLRARNRHVGAVVDVGYSLIAYLRRPTVFTNAAGAAVPDVIVSV